MKRIWQSMQEAFRRFSDHNVSNLGAALAYYSAFSIPPLLLVLAAALGLWVGTDAAQGQLFAQVKSLMGPPAAKAVQDLINGVHQSQHSTLTAIIAGVTLLVGATGIFVQLQSSLNLIWGVQAKRGAGLRFFILHRLLSFAMVLGMAFLLLISLAISTALVSLGKILSHFVAPMLLMRALDAAVSLAVIALVFALLFKWLPDVKIGWRPAWAGGLLTAVLFVVGKLVLSLYLGHSHFLASYGATAILVVLVWTYYSAQIFFFGAEFTAAYAQQLGETPTPTALATFVECPNTSRPKDDEKAP